MSDARIRIACLSFLLAVGCGGGGGYEEAEPAAPAEPAAAEEAAAPAQPTVDETIAAMEQGCAAAAEAMQARQAEKTLYERLGGRDAIHAVVADVVRRHRQNDAIAYLLEGVDDAHLVDQVTDFLGEAAGGDVTYEGRDMKSAHEHLALTNEHFLAAGGDVQAALETAGVGEPEIQEVMCLFVKLRPEVVAESGAEG